MPCYIDYELPFKYFVLFACCMFSLSDARQLTLDPITAHRKLKLSDNNREVRAVMEEQKYPDHPHRFAHWPQLLCETGLTGRCYWEVEYEGRVDIAVTYRHIRRKGNSDDCRFGRNNQSWNIPPPTITSSPSNRVGVYVDCPAGRLSFYRVSSDKLIHLHTIETKFTEHLYPGFGLRPESSVFLCSLSEEESPPV
uniref:B30.2/SPRY domain-containing protein n=1 Tax=Lates calcarifer TaxID=8187 RepID=A0A4W6FWN3_LATCA